MAGFIQVTDTHIVAPGKLVCGRSNTSEALRRAIATINAKLPLLDGIDCVIITGDLTDHGTPEEYAHFTSIMSELQLPWLAIPGNHDQRAPMRAAFAEMPWMPSHGPIHWMRDFGPFAVVGLDTLLEGAHHGQLGPEGLAFIDTTLATLGEQPLVVATHHPWMHTGIPAMDADNLHDGALLMEKLAAYRGSVRMISGHVHRAISGQIGSITCQIGPSTGHAVLTDHSEGHDPQLVLEPGAIMVYRWVESQGATSLMSDVIPTGFFSGPWPFTP